MVKKNACVFISGRGSNLKSLINKSRDYNFPINIKLIICNNESAYGIKHAKKNSIPFLIVDSNNKIFERKIIKEIKRFKISLICLAGYMKIISKNFIKSFGKLIINIHPSLLPKYKGLNTYSRVLKNSEIMTGCTVHIVNEKLDDGKIIAQKGFYISSKDDAKDLERKTQKLEYKTYAEAIINLYRYD